MLTIGVSKSTNIRRHKDYYNILYNGETKLHHYGALRSLFEMPERCNPSFIAIARSGSHLVCAASVTFNEERSSHSQSGLIVSHPPIVDGKYFAPLFPNVEVMGFTRPEFRRKGFATKTLFSLLKKANIPKNYTVYVYSQAMKRMLEKIGFTNVVNLHQTTP
jgi:hypothetical protein